MTKFTSYFIRGKRDFSLEYCKTSSLPRSAACERKRYTDSFRKFAMRTIVCLNLIKDNKNVSLPLLHFFIPPENNR